MIHTKTINRPDGTVVLLSAEYFPNPYTVSSDITVGYFARVQRPGQSDWTLYTDGKPADRSLGGLSVDEYIARGRQGLMAVVRPHEIISAYGELRERLSQAA